MKPQLRTKEEKKKLKYLNYKIQKLNKDLSTNVPSVAEETNNLMTDMEHAEAEKRKWAQWNLNFVPRKK